MPDEPAAGRKQCPQCEKYVPTRSASCSYCNHQFATKHDKTTEMLRSLSKEDFKAILFLAERIKRGQMTVSKPSEPAPTSDEFVAAAGDPQRLRELVDLHQHHKAFRLIDGLTKAARGRLEDAVKETAAEERR